jgi:ferredoxin-thioredoxin reductase catalytic subunit
MTGERPVSQEEIDNLYEQLKEYAAAGGYYLNPDIDFAKALVAGILTNQRRYGYWSCPCRLANGSKEEDMDIICPCDYRDADVVEFGACYCGLYVAEAIARGIKKPASIPERRSPDMVLKKTERQVIRTDISSLPFPVWRCKVCGYLCARNNPPEICPICKARKERFEQFL